MNELLLVAKVNEDIKQIQRIAEDISLIAINATLVARQAGNSAVGFGVVARELRITSDRMATIMLGLSSLIYRMVLATAQGRSLARRMHSLGLTAQSSEQAGTFIAAARQKSQDKMGDFSRDIQALAHEFRGVVNRTGKQSASGMVIARSATIEAAYGGTMQPLLRQIAVRFEASIADLTGHVRALQHQLQDITA
jgi:hypothetical protein